MGFRGATDNYLFGPTRNPFDTRDNTGGSSGGSAAAVADGLRAVRRGHRRRRLDPHPGGLVRRLRLQAVVRPRADGHAARTPSAARTRSSSRARSRARSRTPRSSLTALAGYDPRDPFSLDEDVDFLPATRRSIKGMRIAYSPDLDVFPVDPRIAKVVGEAVEAFEEAGAHVEEVKLGITRDQRELSDLWCRLIIPLNDRRRSSACARAASTCSASTATTSRRSTCTGSTTATGMTVLEQIARPGDPHRGLRRDPGRARRLRPARLPDARRVPVENADDGNTARPGRGQRRGGRPLIGWCLTYLFNFTGHPAASIPAGFADGLPVGHADHRPALCRRRRARGQRRVRAPAPLARLLRSLRRAVAAAAQGRPPGRAGGGPRARPAATPGSARCA